MDEYTAEISASEYDALCAAARERDDLRAENERLRAALREAREALFNAGLDGGDWSVVDDVRGALLDALSGKGET